MGAAGDDEVAVPEGWALVEGRLRRELVFADFAEAWSFMVCVAAAAERLDHHPDWSNSWNRVVIELTSHDVGRVTGRDLALAAEVDRCATARPTTCS